MPERVASALKTALRYYFASWLFLLWGAFCFGCGGAFALLTLHATLLATGVL
jgi:hypothetical protein